MFASSGRGGESGGCSRRASSPSHHGGQCCTADRRSTPRCMRVTAGCSEGMSGRTATYGARAAASRTYSARVRPWSTPCLISQLSNPRVCTGVTLHRVARGAQHRPTPDTASAMTIPT